MDKAGLLRSIAETGYNVGFGAKKNFATHDIVQKAPGLIGFVSLAVGVYALMYEPLNSKWIAATLVVLGIASLYITNYDHNKLAYSDEGERLTSLFYRLRDLYRDVQSVGEHDDVSVYRSCLDAIQSDFFSTNHSKQIMFSDWYAHYKFFWQHQIGWIDEELDFELLRDKVPLTFTLFVIFLVLILGISVSYCLLGRWTFCSL